MTDYSEATSVELVGIGLMQLSEAQDAYNAMLVGNAWSPATIDGSPRDMLRGDAAKAHAMWLLTSADIHFRAAMALESAMLDGEYGDDPEDEVDEAEDDGPPA